MSLSDTQPTTITASLENGALPVYREVTWIPVNLLTIPSLNIRQGDSLKLSAFTGTAGTSEETVTIAVQGETATFTADHSLVHAFNTAGNIAVQITHTLDGNVTTRSATIHVVGAPVLESPVCVVGFYRNVDVPALPIGVSLQLDDRIEVREMMPDGVGIQHYVLRADSLRDYPAVFRLGGNTGPIITPLQFLTTRIRAGSQTGIYYAKSAESSAWNVEMPVIVDGPHGSVVVQYDIFVGGVTFDDGSIRKTLRLPDDLSSIGAHLLRFLKVGTSGSNCHRCSVFQGSVRIAYYQ